MRQDRDVQRLLDTAEPPKGRVAVATIDAMGVAIAGDARARSGLFELGSITKTMTATLLATLTLTKELTLDTTVGEVLGPAAGAVFDVSMRELATHTSGLPRIAPNAIGVPWWPRDPYRFYGAERLYGGLKRVVLKDRGTIRYSNLGYDLLGHCLGAAAGKPFAELLRERVLGPAGLASARCQPCRRRGLLKGHGSLMLGGRRWHQPLPGAGGVDCRIADLAQWAVANAFPDSTSLGPAIRLCHQVHAKDTKQSIGLAWHHGTRTLWHNGGTGSFQGVIGIVPGRGGACGLATLGPGPKYVIDRPVLQWIRDFLLEEPTRT